MICVKVSQSVCNWQALKRPGYKHDVTFRCQHGQAPTLHETIGQGLKCFVIDKHSSLLFRSVNDAENSFQRFHLVISNDTSLELHDFQHFLSFSCLFLLHSTTWRCDIQQDDIQQNVTQHNSTVVNKVQYSAKKKINQDTSFC